MELSLGTSLHSIMADPESISTRVSVRWFESISHGAVLSQAQEYAGRQQNLGAAFFGAELLVLLDVRELAELWLDELLVEIGAAFHILHHARVSRNHVLGAGRACSQTQRQSPRNQTGRPGSACRNS